MPRIETAKIAGGYVRRTFTENGVRLLAGEELSAERIKAWPNYKVLQRGGFIETYPPSPDARHAHEEKFLLHEGFGKYDVIAGRKLNDNPLTKHEAETLAAGG